MDEVQLGKVLDMKEMECAVFHSRRNDISTERRSEGVKHTVVSLLDERGVGAGGRCSGVVS